MVYDKWLAPFGPMGPRGHCTLGDACIEEEIVQLGLAELLEGLLGKRLDLAKVGEFQWQHGQAVRGGVKSQVVIRLLRGLGVAGAEDKSVRLGLCEQLLDQFEALAIMQNGVSNRTKEPGEHLGRPTRPEDAPVATTVFAARLAI